MALFEAPKFLKKLFSRQSNPTPHIRVQAPQSVPGSSHEDSKEVFACVSRHGLLLLGVRCPSCSETVARHGEWEKIVETTWGEAVMCSPCKKVLLASPDTDGDPIKLGEQYDEALYHTFKRPEGWVKPRQKTLKRPSIVGDWVVVTEKTLVEINSVLRDINGGEGRIIEILTEGQARFAMDGNVGLGGSGLGDQIVTIPLSAVKVMASQHVSVGDTVQITRGENEGMVGELLTAERGNCQVLVKFETRASITIKVPIERIERVEET